jgi:nucleoside-diphosphate-sugar epimerase
VFTSSAGTIRPSGPFEDSTEESDPPLSYLTEYERTKDKAEKRCMDYVQKGLDVVIVNPSRVYGPGMIGESNSVTRIISLYDRGKWRIMPGDGTSYGNYVFIDDIVSGHICAMEKGIAGNRYLLGGENVTFEQFFTILGEVSGKKHRLIRLPAPVMAATARALFLIAGLFRKDPLVTPAWVERYLQHRRLSSAKAEMQLGYQVTPLREGMKKTLLWLNH